MNMLTDPLPCQVSVGGAACRIRTDFRVSIRFELLMQNPDLENREKAIRALNLYYPRVPCDVQEASDRMIWFYMCGKEAACGESADAGEEVRKVYDFDYDDAYIYAAFLEQYGIDLQDVEHLHWWKFRAMFRALNENCEFVKIMGYRGMKIPPKMPKEEKAFYRKMKRIYALPLPKDEQEKNDAITKALMNGGDVSGLL